jgi:hypothetical protein
MTQMSVLTDVPNTDILEMLNNDRAGDSDASLDELGICSKKRFLMQYPNSP